MRKLVLGVMMVALMAVLVGCNQAMGGPTACEDIDNVEQAINEAEVKDTWVRTDVGEDLVELKAAANCPGYESAHQDEAE